MKIQELFSVRGKVALDDRARRRLRHYGVIFARWARRRRKITAQRAKLDAAKKT